LSNNNNLNPVSELYQKMFDELSKAIVGKGDVERALIIALLAGGHVLIEGSPGTAKTKIAQSFAETVGATFKRIQFTPDMMPSDITGFYIYSTGGTPRFVEGPLFAHIVLADELNRTTPRTQSALLEAMQESRVTIEGKTYSLSRPFMVIATQVPAGGEGTYPLTDVQIDRFLLKIDISYPQKEEEIQIIGNIDRIDEPDIKPVTGLNEVLELQHLVKQVHVSADIVEYIASVVTTLRSDADVSWGPSVRAGISLFKCSRVLAMLDGRDYVIPDDIKSLCRQAIEHRLRIKSEAEMDGVTPAAVIDRVVESLPVPKL